MVYDNGMAPPRRRRRRVGPLGCLGTLVLIAVVALAVEVFSAPWALHLGGGFNPLERWSGIARAHTPDGGDVGIQLNLKVNALDRRSCSRLTGRCSDFGGTAVICTRAGRFTLSRVDGSVDGYWSIDGQPMTVSMTHGTMTPARYLSLTFTGTWHGPAYEASDGGYLSRDFLPDGNARSQVGSVDPAKAVRFALQPGDFTALCHTIGAPG
ncbi:MAG: hypothetical protein E6G35_00430 [Actinobacteria bacterium]|nr:MAG: hypothetical protein E6G35_00430 [Actinomycetota bacterium]